MSENINYVLKKEDEGLYIKEILQRRFKFSSRLMRKMKVVGGIQLNGKAVRLRDKGRAGDVLAVAFPEERSWFEPEDIPVAAVYEDGELLIADKQPGLVVHPTKNYQSGTLANALANYIEKKGESWKIRFVNRLDRDTSGLIIVGKNAHAQDFLMKEMEENRTVKKYLAIVHGIMEGEGTIDEPIDKDPNHKARRMVTPLGYSSVTHYKVLKSWPDKQYGPIKGFSLVELRLETGRTHQIRVHLSYLGHPIAGDELYGQLFGYDVPPEWMPRQALHAYELQFRHPIDGKIIKVNAPMPEDMENCIKYIESL